MNRTEKVELGSQFKERFQKANVALFADYKGITANQADLLRKRLREKQTEVKVLKNNVARKIVADGSFGDEAKAVMDSVVGPTLVAFSYGDPSAAAKVMNEFAKECEAFQIKDSIMGKKKLTRADVTALASLPSREVMLSMLLSTMNGPARSFVSVLAAVPRSFVTVLSAIEKKKADAS